MTTYDIQTTSVVEIPTTVNVLDATVSSVNVVEVGLIGPQGATGTTGPQGATGPQGNKGDTGAQGPSGVVAVTSPITNSGTSTSATIGIDSASTTQSGAVQLTDSTSSTSTTTAATPNSVKSAYDLANTANTAAGTKVSSVSGTAPISVTSGTTPTVSIASASTSTAGAVQLTDSTSSTSTTTAATPNSVKTAYDLANGKVSSVSGTSPISVTSGTTPTVSISNISDADISATAGIVDTKLATISTAGKVSNSATTATSSNTASAIVARDSSGNFTAGTITNAGLSTTSGNIALTSSGQLSVQSSSTSVVPVIVKPTGTVTISGLTATHSGGVGTLFDTISGFSSVAGFYVGQTVTLSGFSNSNFNGTTTVTQVLTSTLRVTSLNSTNGTGTGGSIAFTGTQQNLQEWQYNSGTASASVSASGVFTGNGSGLSSISASNVNSGTLNVLYGGTGNIYGSPLVGHAQLNALRTKPTNNTATEAVFVDSSGSVNYLNLDTNTTYFFEGWAIYSMKATATASLPRISLIYLDSSGSALTPQNCNLRFNVFTATAVIGTNATTTANSDSTSSGTGSTGATNYYINYRGHIQTHASTAGKMNIGLGQSVAGSSAAGDFLTSTYINVQKVNTGLDTDFGNWSA